MNEQTASLDIDLHFKQGLALFSQATEVGYGGAAGGGKSHLGRISAIYYCAEIPGLQVYLFRRTHNELDKNHFQGPTGFPAMLNNWIQCGLVKIVKDEIRFWNGSKIFACHCQHEKDVFSWLGPEMHYLIIEQAEQFSPFMIQMLRGRNRIPDTLKIPEKYLLPKEYWRTVDKPRYKFPCTLYTFNPGGVGHVFFKQKFVKARKPMEIEQMPADEGGKLRQFIPAKLEDNPSVDPVEYEQTLSGLPEKMRKALRDGNFDTVIGAYFPQMDRAKHLIKPFLLPKHWPRFMSYDHGACGDGDPFSIGWYSIAGETIQATNSLGDPLLIPKDSMVCYRRWNGRGLPKQDAAQIAEGIHKREHEEILFRIAGGDILEQRGHGESIFSIFATNGINFMRADMRRLNGWAQVDYRLNGKDGMPLSYWFEDCEDDLETIGSLQHDLTVPDDIAKGDDHDADRHRYACMTRPVAIQLVEAKKPDYSDKNKRATVASLVKQINQPDKSQYVTRR